MKIAVKRCVRYEHSGHDAENLLDELDDRLDEDALHDLFAGEDDINVHIARLCEELGVAAPGSEDSGSNSDTASTPAPEHPPIDEPQDAQVGEAAAPWRSSG